MNNRASYLLDSLFVSVTRRCNNINLICSNVSNPASPFINPCAEQAVQFVLLPPNDPGYAQFNHPWSHDDKAGPCRQQQSIHPVARQAFPLSIHGLWMIRKSTSIQRGVTDHLLLGA
ncbi:hypothetical protein FPOA_02819 [Fusarium poae]|uniref:Uncharacterized protein n=1 Tax=Fusarium poae TaxID=36050 RepID=A0A1B8B835_FUSPO|nr:hypothetical protein FPOA_02819 [Fusarium poae]